MQHLQSALGIVALLAFAFAISENHRAVSWKHAVIGLVVTFATAALLLKVPGVSAAFAVINDAVGAIASATKAGTSFVFGYLGGAPLPYDLKTPGADFILALQALPVVLVMSVLTTLLFYWRILPPIVRGFAWLLERTLGVGGAVGLSTAANIFLGMVEAPLFIRPYLASLSRSELFIVMTGGMAGIAGTVLVLYATILAPVIPEAAGHFVIASVLGAPAAILISLMMVPPTGEKRTEALLDTGPLATSTMDAIVRGTAAGLELLLSICAMLIVLVALVHLANAIIGLLPNMGGAPITLQRLLGYLDGAGVLADGHSVGSGAHRRRPDGDEDHPQRIHRLCGTVEAAARRARSALAADHPLRDVRLCQFRLARHHDRGALDHGAGAARRHRLARPQVDRLRNARDLPDGRDRRGANVMRLAPAGSSPRNDRPASCPDKCKPPAAAVPPAWWRSRSPSRS